MAITAALVKELRERSGAAMMDCKRALEATGGDVEAALEKMRKDGQAKADKKAGRVAAEGVLSIAVAADGKQAVMVEYNSETDFVSKGDEFQTLAQTAADVALSTGKTDPQELLAESANGQTLDEARRGLISKLGENMSLRRVAKLESAGQVFTYLHGSRIGVMVALEGGNEELGKDIAMHVAASAPAHVSADDVPAELLDKEREILIAQAEGSGKPREIIEKMVEGRVRKYLQEITLVGQPFVKDPDVTVEKLLADAGAKVTGFVRLEVGEGIEKQEANFADEVAAQAAAAAGA
ncbi:elongation factor Ts [Oceanococcus atlanticus]|uniref:Elongation factor Ts n=1 Tax=Oceanococcus atlanticus TaxID=1317117 RepID=A0A1Y1SDG3_9GAMM|nr:translation elongation factor Ts [Oceanococcus atlanticus]ORE87038.1 elongation factor Ts [Oceanococcus atlanticus]RZO86791.1 MAG: elongation factor Ts [Oceanococcus sp.]